MKSGPDSATLQSLTIFSIVALQDLRLHSVYWTICLKLNSKLTSVLPLPLPGGLEEVMEGFLFFCPFDFLL